MKGMEDIKEIVEIKRAQDIQPPLEPGVVGMLGGIMDGARESFEHDHECFPFFFTLKGDHMQPHSIPNEAMSPELKQAFFKWMHKQIPDNDCCIFINEVWMAKAMKSETDQLLIMPSDRLDRQEMVMINLWTPTRSLSLVAEITRNPDALGPWERFHDTANPGAVKAEGAMIAPGKEDE